jgi:protein-disulfide isomerase
MFNKKKTILTGIILTIITSFLIILIFLSSKVNDKREAEREIKTEAKEIIDANKEAIKKAREEGSGQVKPISEDDHVLGDINAPVQLIIYSDFECPFCADFSNTVKQIIEEFGDKVAVVFRHFPMTTIHHNAMSSAIAAECAAEQGKFWEMHDKLFADNVDKKFSIDQFKSDAAEIGLDAARFNQCLDTEKYKDKVEAQVLEGRNAGVLGTPSSFVNGQALPGAYPFEDFTDSQGYERIGMKNIILKHLEKSNNK